MVLLVYQVIAPFTSFVLWFVFGLMFVAYRHQFVFVYPKMPDSGGKVVGVQNIPQTSKGDNVLVAARVGETFLNAKQTKLLRPVLSAARIPGFANGGMLGAPNVGALDNGLMRAFNERTNAISGQVMESKVYLVTDELKRDTAEGDRIKRKVILR
jgi:hypothetical protein